MPFLPPFPLLRQCARFLAFLRGTALPVIAALFLTLIICATTRAQGGVPLITVATDQSQLNLSNQFGIPAGTAINQAGDFAFIGNGASALFLRAAGATSATRILQTGDQVPGINGSRVNLFMSALGINSSKTILFEISYTMSDGELHDLMLTYDGTAFHAVVSSDDLAPLPEGTAYGLTLRIGGINDHGDISFGAIPAGQTSLTFYIKPSGSPVVRVAATNDAPPPTCTWCVVPGTTALVILPFSVSSAPQINALGQILIGFDGGLFIGNKDGSLTTVPLAGSGLCSPPSVPTSPGLGSFFNGTPVYGVIATFSVELNASAVLNNAGAVAFMNTTSSATAICLVPAGASAPTPEIATGGLGPASIGGGIFSTISMVTMDDSNDILFQASVTGANTPFALLRFHPSSQVMEAVAYNGEIIAGVSGGTTFASPTRQIQIFTGTVLTTAAIPIPAFSASSMASNGLASFKVLTTQGGYSVYQQTAANAPTLVAQEGQTATFTGGGIYNLGPALPTATLSNRSTFFPSYITNGAADFAELLGTPGNIQSLMNTGDVLPSGAQTTFVTAAPRAAGRFVAFIAQPAGGRRNLMESDITAGTTARILTDGQIAEPSSISIPGATVVSSNFFVNENGQVAFEILTGNVLAGPTIGSGSISFGGNTYSNPLWSTISLGQCGAVYEWSPGSGVTKIAAPGDATPISGDSIYCAMLNSGPPSPMNSAGQVSFIGQFIVPVTTLGSVLPSIANGIFLYTPGSPVGKIVATNDTISNQALPTTLVPSISVAMNSAGQTAFGAQVGNPMTGSLVGFGTGFQAFFIHNADGTVQKIVANGDAVPRTSDTFGAPHFISGLSSAGDFAFTAATGTASDGIFFAPSTGIIQAIAENGGAVPGTSGATFSFASPLVLPPATTPALLVGANSNEQFALMNGESDIVVRAGITGGTSDSGYFRILHASSTPSALQSVVLQGQAAPGGGTFNTLLSPSILGPYFSLGPDGKFAFLNFITLNGIRGAGIFVAHPDGTLLKIIASGDSVPGGGTLRGLAMNNGLAAGDAGKFVFLAGILGGSAHEAIFATAIPAGTASSTIVLGPLQGSPVAQQPVTLTAMITGASATPPTGTVTFFANGVSLGTGALNSAGQALLMTSTLAAGSISIVAQYDGDGTFASEISAPLAVIVTGFAPPPASLIVADGNSLVIPLTLFAPSGSNMTFTLSCSGLPANSSCSFDSNPVTPGPNGTTVHLTLTTMSNARLPLNLPRQGPSPFRTIGIFGIILALFGGGAIGLQQSPRRRLAFSLSFAVFALAVVMAGCGSQGGSTSFTPTATPAGTTAFTVSGSSGGTAVSTVVHITVQ